MMILGKLICWITGKHKRGQMTQYENRECTIARYVCPRCFATWTRKVKVRA